MHHKSLHAVVEVGHAIVQKADKAVDSAESAGKVAKVITASHAFRRYDWLHNAPVLNTSHNLQGMVLSAKWRAAYNVSVKYSKWLEHYHDHVATFATVAAALVESSGQTLNILESDETLDIKGAKLATQATAVAMNVLTGVVTAPAHIILLSLQGYSNIAELAAGKPLGTYRRTLKAIDVSIQSAAKQVSDGKNIYLFVNTQINPRVSKALGF
jgi:hypothetical protein